VGRKTGSDLKKFKQRLEGEGRGKKSLSHGLIEVGFLGFERVVSVGDISRGKRGLKPVKGSKVT